MISKSQLKKHLVNVPGWRTKEKIVVLESDDWGTIRTSSKANLEKLKSFGLPVAKCAYMSNDALASDTDLELLFNLLMDKSVKGKMPVITANFLTANPDFEKIKADGFRTYFYESCLSTLERYPNHAKVPQYWKKGNEKGFFRPQLHGREHLNISRWMRDLQNEVKETKFAFDLEMFGISGTVSKENRGSYLAAFDSGAKERRYDRSEIITDAVHQFEAMFGYKPQTFIAPNYTWDDEVEEALYKNEIKFIQGGNSQRFSRDHGEAVTIKRHFFGQRNKREQTYLIRNCSFEPSSDLKKDWVNSCLKEISTAFLWNKPAVISIHRLNFVGFINESNRDHNLRLFETLLDEINKKWPSVQYMSSDELIKKM